MSLHKLAKLDREIPAQQLETMRQKLHAHLTCSICGQPKVHYRLYGYRCHNPEHAEMERMNRKDD